MQAKSFSYWETKWNDYPETTDVEKTIAILKSYIQESKPPVVSINFLRKKIVGLSANFARAPEVEYVLPNQHADNSTVESVLAYLKQKINNYPSYQLLEESMGYEKDFSSPLTIWINRGLVVTPKVFVPKPDHFYVNKLKILNNTIYFDFKVIALNGELISDELVLKLPNINNKESESEYPSTEITLKDLGFYFSDILEITSTKGITRGGGIHRQLDNLAVILDVIKQKTTVDYFSLNATYVIDKYNNIDYQQHFAAASNWQKQVLKKVKPQHNVNPNPYCSLRYINTNQLENNLQEIELWNDIYHKHTTDGINTGLAIKVTLSSLDAYDKLLTEIKDNNLPTPVEKFFIPGPYSTYPDINEHETNVLWKDLVPGGYYFINKNREKKPYAEPRKLSEQLRLISGIRCYYDIPIEICTRNDLHPPALGNRQEKQYSLFIANFSSENQILLTKFLDILESIEPKISDILQDFCDAIRCKRIILDDIQIDYATRRAIQLQQTGEYEYIWTLANHYYQDIYLADDPDKNITTFELHRIFSAITASNPYYRQAQSILSDLTFDSPNNLEQAIRYALSGNDPSHTARLLGSYCDFGFKQFPLTIAQPNADTIIALANLIKQQGFFKETKTQATQTTPEHILSYQAATLT
ncbi:MAG: hypothetical protein Q8R83_00055 [Legionellaceae bacterium]|nr:hypothetical protein [Legionellaceae bacterium]